MFRGRFVHANRNPVNERSNRHGPSRLVTQQKMWPVCLQFRCEDSSFHEIQNVEPPFESTSVDQLVKWLVLMMVMSMLLYW